MKIPSVIFVFLFLIKSVALSVDYISSDVTSGLNAYWTFEETKGQRDDALRINNLTDTNNVGTATGKIGNGISINTASNQNLIASSNGSLQLTGPFTIAGWCSMASTNNNGNARFILAKREPTGISVNYDLFVSNTKKFTFDFDNGTGYCTAVANTFGAIATNTFYFVVCIYDGTNVKISVNNGAFDSVSCGGMTPIADPGNLRFGCVGDYDKANYNWDGVIDEFGIWNRELSSTEIAHLYNSGNGRTLPPSLSLNVGLGAYYSFQEKSGLRSDCVNGNHLTSNNSVGYAAAAIGNGASFVSASNQNLSATNSTSLQFTGPFTIAGWCSMASTNSNGLARFVLAKREHTGISVNYDLFVNPSNKFVFDYDDGTGYRTAIANSAGAISLNTLYFVTCVYDGSNVKISVDNGSFDSVSTGGVAPIADNGSLRFGCVGDYDTTNYNWDGVIDDFGLWHRALTSDEISHLYNSGYGSGSPLYFR